MLNWSDIIVALIALAGTFAGTAYGIHKANNLTIYRLEQLEKKVDIHNGVQERVLVLEQQLKEFRTTLDKVAERLTRTETELDNAYTLAEKNEQRVQFLEKIVDK